MSVIKKPDLKIFAQDAKTGEVETFPDILRGWGVTLDRTAGKPPLEWFNAIGKRVDEWLMYLTQRGVAEWDTTLSYPKTAIVQFNSIVYVSIKETKGEQPDKSQASWSTLGVFLGLGNYSTTAEMNLALLKKIDKANITNQTGNSTELVASQQLVTAETGKKASKDELNNGLALKFDKTGGIVDGFVSAKSIEVTKDGSYIQLDVANNPSLPSINSKTKDKPWRNHILQDASGTIMHLEDITQGTGQSVNKAVSQKLFTDLIATKFNNTGGRIEGQTSVRGGFDADAISVSGANEAYIQLDIAQPGTARINTKRAGKQWRNHILQDASGTIMQLEDIVQSTGQEASKVMSQQASTKMAFGIAQTYKNVTAERVKGTTYTNATDSAICVSISTLTPPTRNLSVTAIVNNVTIIELAFDSSHSSPPITFIVPKGATYNVNSNATISMWTELR